MSAWLAALGRAGGWLLLGWALIIAAVLGLGTLLTGPVRDEWPLSDEDELSAALEDGRTSGWDAVTHWWSTIGDTTTIVVGCAVVAVLLRLALHRWRESLFVIACVVGQVVVFLTTAALIDRERPDVVHLDEAPPTSSFPSGHLSASIALYGSLAIVILWRMRRSALRWFLAVVLVALPVLVAYARLYRGMHHPSDLVGSIVNASCCIALAWAVVVRRARLPEDGDRRTGRDSDRPLEVAA